VETVLTKVEYVSDKSGESELLLKIQQLESDKQLFSTKIEELEGEVKKFSTITIEMENNFQNEMSKKDEELDELSKNDKTKLLQETLQNLRGELQQKNQQINELEKINRDLLNGNTNQAYLLRGSNLNRRV
jgi:predicted RNase H-like nuclease (RuvC/YqgF family)